MLDKREFDPEALDPVSLYKMMAGTIVPRPIGFITTMGSDGTFNAAPFSFFNMVSHIPPLVSVSVTHIKPIGGQKDTLRNIISHKQFVVNLVSEAIIGAVDRCSESYPAGVDELAVSGLTPVTSTLVKPPCVLESPVNFECELAAELTLPGCANTLLIGRVARVHIRRDLVGADFRIDHASLAAVGRIAGNLYCRTGATFTLSHDGFAAVAAETRQNPDVGH
jgi:flavin reductase (DIM6/NTAB) family NADH-FMN oxidoreductase RutF